MRNIKEFSVLIPDGDSPYFLGVLYGFAEIKGIDIYIISTSRHCPIKYSLYIKNYSYYPNSDNYLDTLRCIDNEVEKYNIDLVMPVAEFTTSLLLKYKNLLSCKDKFCLLPSVKSFKIAANKALFAKFMQQNTINCSNSVVLKSGEIISEFTMAFPVIVKPIEGFGGGVGIHKFNNIESLEQFFANNKFEYDYLIEEYVSGYDLGCNVLCKNGTILAYTIQKGNLFSDQPFKPQIGLDFIHEPSVYNEVKKVIASLNWSGVANIDLRYDNLNNNYKILELNPRFWYTLDASICSGVNFPYLLGISSLGIPFNMPKYKHMSYLNFQGLAKRIKEDKRFLFRLNFLFHNTILKYTLKDPLLISYRLYRKIRHLVLKW